MIDVTTSKAEQIADAVAAAINKFQIAYSHNVLLDTSHADACWRVHEATGEDPFIRDVWLGEFDNKADAQALVTTLRRAAAVKAVEDLLDSPSVSGGLRDPSLPVEGAYVFFSHYPDDGGLKEPKRPFRNSLVEMITKRFSARKRN